MEPGMVSGLSPASQLDELDVGLQLFDLDVLSPQSLDVGAREAELEATATVAVDTSLPSTGPGFYSYVGEGRRYGTRETIAALERIAAEWHRSAAPPMGVGDISFQGGGPMPPHAAHQKGLDVDIRPVRADGRAEPVTTRDPAYSRAATQQLVDLVRANGVLPVRFILFNDARVRGVQPAAGHDNHLHVRFDSPAAPTRRDSRGETRGNGAGVGGGSTSLPGLTPSEERALRITSTFETGRPLDFGGFVGDFDGQGLSFGLLQWNIGTGSLQPLLRAFCSLAPHDFDAVFGPDAPTVRRVFVTTASQKEPTAEQRQFADAINASNRRDIIEPWRTYLQRLGQSATFQRIQLEAVRDRLRYAANSARIFGLRSERALAFFFDTVTQHGNWWLKKKNRESLIARQRAQTERKLGRPLTEPELLAIIADVLAATVNPKWAGDVRARRMVIVNGRGAVHRSHYDLTAQFGLTDQPFNSSVL